MISKWLNILLGLLFIPLFVVLFGGSYANAVSDYDDLIQLTNNLELVDSADPNNEDKNVDLTIDWYTESLELLDIRCSANGGNWCDIYNFWVDFDFANDHFIVKKNENNTVVEILASDDPNAYMDFVTSSSIKYLNANFASGYTTIRMSIIIDEGNPDRNDKNIVVNSRSIWTSNVTRSVTADNQPWLIFLGTPELITPVGYEGEIPPETYEVPVEREGFVRYDLSFSYDVSMANGIKVTNTTSEELTAELSGMWDCYFIISKADDFDNAVEEDIYYLDSCDDRTEIIYNPPVVLNEEYIVTLWLSHNAYGEYTYVSQRLKVILEPYTGDTVGGDDLRNLDRCFIDTIPWIDIIACYKTLSYTLNIMTFGTFNFTGIFNWNFDPQCRQLETLDNWLNLKNKTVCPAFNEEVRNTITPFVTILLGTIVITLVVRSVSPNNPHHFHRDL